MSQYITDIAVSRDQDEETQLQNEGFLRINVILNKDQGSPVYLWYKQKGEAITRIQVSFNDETSNGLTNAGYTKVERSPTTSGDIFLWYFKGTTRFDTPIEKLEVSTNADDEAEKMKLGWERAGCNLSGVSGKWVYLWLKRKQQTYICDVTATNSYGSDEDLFQAGYIRIDQSTTTISIPFLPFPFGIGSSNFLWYRLTTDTKSALTDLQISINPSQYQQYQKKKYTPVSVKLNEGTDGNPVYLWYKKDEGGHSVESMLLLLDKSAMGPFKRAGIDVSEENINYGAVGDERHLCVLKKY